MTVTLAPCRLNSRHKRTVSVAAIPPVTPNAMCLLASEELCDSTSTSLAMMNGQVPPS